MAKKRVTYVTTNKHKAEENHLFVGFCEVDGVPIRDRFEFSIRPERVTEILAVDLDEIVRDEVRKAYQLINVPCIVEHAGLVFEAFRDKHYPGGLTKAMWDALGDRFVAATGSSGQRAIARAVVAYCDGMQIRIFRGETPGTIAAEPRGSRAFYWDTVFIPDDAAGKTYAEICDDPALGVRHKVEHLSQSTKAMIAFIRFLDGAGPSALWPLE